MFLPYREFLELWQELNLKRRADEGTKPPQSGVVSRAEYTGTVEGDMLTVDARVTVQSFKEGWLTVPLAGSEGLTGVTDVDAGGATLSSRKGGYDLILPDKGTYELKMKLHAPVMRTGGRSTVKIGLPSAAVSRFTATVPDTGWEFDVTPAAAFSSRPVGEKTELSFFFGSGSSFDVAWSKPEAATTLKPLILAATRVTGEVRGGSLASTVAVDLRVLRAPVGEIVLLVPAGQSVLSLTGADVKEWKLDGAEAPAGGPPQKLTVLLNAPVKDKWSGTVSLEIPLPKLPADASVPLVQVAGASQDRGEVSVAAESRLDVLPKPGEGLIQQTAEGQAPGGLVNVVAYRYLKHPAVLALAVSEAKPQVDVESTTALSIDRDRARLTTTFQYSIRRVGIFDARVQLPAGWTGWEVVGVDAESWTVEKSGNTEVLALKLPKQTVGATAFTLRGQQTRANATDDVTVPVFAPLNVARHDARIGVAVHSSLEANTKDRGSLSLEDVTALRSAFPASAGSKSGPPVERETVSLAFRHRDAVQKPALLSFKPRPPQVNVQILTQAQIKEQSTAHRWELAFDVGYAAIDKFILAVPKAVAGDVRLVDPQVKEVRKDYQPPAGAPAPTLPNAEAYVLWEVVLRSERMNQFQLSLSHEQPGTGAQTSSVELLQVHVPGAFQETGQVAVLKDDNLEIVNAASEGMEEIDPRELSGTLQRSGVFLAYKYKALPFSLKMDVARNAYLKVPQAVVTYAVLTTAVSTDQAQTTEVIFWVKNNAQQFLTVALPKGAGLLSDVMVNGAAQQPMKREGADDLLIRLPSDAASRRAAFPVRFVYEVPSRDAGRKMGWTGGIHVDVPVLPGEAKVLETHHAVFLPESHDYTGFQGPMTVSLRDRGWLQLRGLVNALVPALGPSFTQDRGEWTSVPAIPEQQKASFEFQVPTQGRSVILHRLGIPAATEIAFRARSVSYALEGLVFLVVLGLGFLLWRASVGVKFQYLVLFGLGGLLLTGILSPANGQEAKGSVLAAGLMAGLWAVAGLLRGFKGIVQKIRLVPVPAPAPAPVPPASAAAPGPVVAAPAAPPAPVPVPTPTTAAAVAAAATPLPPAVDEPLPPIENLPPSTESEPTEALAAASDAEASPSHASPGTADPSPEADDPPADPSHGHASSEPSAIEFPRVDPPEESDGKTGDGYEVK